MAKDMGSEDLAGVRSDSVLRVSVPDQIVRAIRDAILDGSLKPGAPLKEIPLSKKFGVSRNTVREALRVLTIDGLVTHHMHRGASVTQYDAASIRDIFNARRVIEVSSAHAMDGDNAEGCVESLQGTLREMTKAADDGDWQSLVQLDLAFHKEMVDAIGSRRLSDFYAGLQRELRLGLLLVDRDTRHLKRYVTEHRAIARAASSQNIESLVMLVQKHLDDSQRQLVTAIAADDG